MTRFTWFRRLAVSVVAVAGVATFAGLPEQVAAADEFAPLFTADAETNAHSALLQERGATVMRRIAYKEQLVAGLLERRYGLDEVAREFVLVIAEDEVNLTILRRVYAGATDEAKAARNVLDHVRAQPLPEYEMALTVARLQADFRRLYPTE